MSISTCKLKFMWFSENILKIKFRIQLNMAGILGKILQWNLFLIDCGNMCEMKRSQINTKVLEFSIQFNLQLVRINKLFGRAMQMTLYNSDNLTISFMVYNGFPCPHPTPATRHFFQEFFV